MSSYVPSYTKLFETGELHFRIKEAYHHLRSCDCCMRQCGVDRTKGELGICQTGIDAQVSNFGPHFGEEKPLRGFHGSGTIFFTHCNLQCVYCQNYDISQEGNGSAVDDYQLAQIMIDLQNQGCHNINLVSPSHIIPQFLASLLIAIPSGLYIPIIYNTGGYDSIEMLSLLDGIIDIYMPDIKYSDQDTALRLSKVHNYPQVNQRAVKIMYSQVGDLQINEAGLATHGLLVRHLVLPNNLAGTRQIIQFLSEDVSKNTYLNLMDQYRPEYDASNYPEINRIITGNEYSSAIDITRQAGIHRLEKDYSGNL